MPLNYEVHLKYNFIANYNDTVSTALQVLLCGDLEALSCKQSS
jgi:hypothetical protein